MGCGRVGLYGGPWQRWGEPPWVGPREAPVRSMIELRHVTKTYGPVRALAGVNVSLPEGAVSVIQGANGSGKSTLLAIVGTLARPTSGVVDHGSLGSTRQAVRRALGWLGHESLCYPDLTGRQNLELAARLHGLDARSAVTAVCARFDLASFVDRPVRTYSRGQRQRVALARALVHGPRLLLLDEPTSGLDSLSVRRLVAVVREESREGATVVLVTHEAALASELPGAKVVTLDRGRVVST